MSKLKKVVVFLVIFVIGLAIFVYNKYRWIVYTNKDQEFSVKYPGSWSHKRIVDEEGVISEIWFIEGGGSLGESGKSREGDDGVTLYIYKDRENQIFSNQNRGPFEHNGKFYYFDGSETETVNQIISSFEFIN